MSLSSFSTSSDKSDDIFEIIINIPKPRIQNVLGIKILKPLKE